MVRLTGVPEPGEAEVICSLLRAEGIFSMLSPPVVFAESGAIEGCWTEVFVRDADLQRAQELLATKTE